MTDTVGYAPVIKLPRSKSSSSNFPTRRDKSDHLVSDTLFFEGLSRASQITEDDLMDLMHECQPLEIHMEPDTQVDGFIKFANKDGADRAYSLFNGISLPDGDKLQLHINHPNVAANPKPEAIILQAKHLPLHTNNNSLYDLFRPYGPIQLCKTVAENGSAFEGTALIHYFRQLDADSALGAMNGTEVDGNIISVVPFNPPTARKRPQSMMLPPTSKLSPFGNFPNANAQDSPLESPVDFKNLYIKNLDIGIKSADLFNLFKGFGHVVSARVMSNPATGFSKGYGFVSYTSPVSASAALHDMNGRMIGSKALIVAFHEPKKPKLDKRMQSSPPEAWSPGMFGGQGTYAGDSSDTSNVSPQSFQSPKRQSELPNGSFLTSTPEIPEEPEDSIQVSNRMRDLGIGQQPESPSETNARQLQQKPSEKPRSLASLASGTSISPLPQVPAPTAATGYKVTPDGRPTLRRRNSLESVSSVVTETSSAIKHQKMTEAVMRCGDYGNKVGDIVDMLLTLKRKDRSLCLFNEEFLREKIQLAIEAMDAFDEEDDEEEEPVPYVPLSRPHRATTTPTPELSRNRANHRMSLPPNFAYIMPGTPGALAEIALPKRESKAIPIVAPPSEQSRAKPEPTNKPSPPASKEKALHGDIDKFLDSIKDKPIHEQKQQLGDRLFPLVKATGTKQAPKVTIRLLDTIDLRELAHLMYNQEVLTSKVQAIFATL